MRATPFHGLIIDLALILAATVLALGHVVPGEGALSFLFLYGGVKFGRGALRGGGGGDDGGDGDGPGAAGGTRSALPASNSSPSSTSSARSFGLGEVSIAAALGLSLVAIFVPHYRSA